jgi:hypothetical protein
LGGNATLAEQTAKELKDIPTDEAIKLTATADIVSPHMRATIRDLLGVEVKVSSASKRFVPMSLLAIAKDLRGNELVKELFRDLLDKWGKKLSPAARGVLGLDGISQYYGNMSKYYTNDAKQVSDHLKHKIADGQMSKSELATLAKHVGVAVRETAKEMDSSALDSLCWDIAKKIAYIDSTKLPNGKCAPYTKHIAPAEMDKIRKKIHKEFQQFTHSVSDMTEADLERLFDAYDREVFSGDLKEYINSVKYSLTFKLAGEETFTTEGFCSLASCDYTITIPIHFFDRVKRGKPTNVAGHQCYDQIECLQRVMEHEMTHLIIFMFCGDPFVTNQHGKLFMSMVGDLFGHTDYHHYI